MYLNMMFWGFENRNIRILLYLNATSNTKVLYLKKNVSYTCVLYVRHAFI